MKTPALTLDIICTLWIAFCTHNPMQYLYIYLWKGGRQFVQFNKQIPCCHVSVQWLITEHEIKMWYESKSGTRGHSWIGVCHLLSYHILTSSAIYYWTDTLQHGMYLFYIIIEPGDMKKAYISHLAEVSIVVVLACKVLHKQVSYGTYI